MANPDPFAHTCNDKEPLCRRKSNTGTARTQSGEIMVKRFRMKHTFW